MMNLHDFLNRYPPYVVRLVARDGRRPLTDRQIAEAAGISNHTVWRVSHARSWDGITVGVASRFCEACGVNLLRPGKLREYLARSRMVHLRSRRKYVGRLMK